MKIVIAIVVLMASCSSLPQSRATKTIPVSSPKPLELNIPKDPWEPLFFKAIDESAALSGLRSLRSYRLADGDFEIRVWHGFGVTALRGFVLTRVNGQWSAVLLRAIPRNGASNESQPLREPKSGWEASLRRLEQAGLFTLPDAIAIHCLAGVNDGAGYVVEFNRDGVYRTYMYENPDYARCNEAKRMIQIGDIISEEFGVPAMATK